MNRETLRRRINVFKQMTRESVCTQAEALAVAARIADLSALDRRGLPCRPGEGLRIPISSSVLLEAVGPSFTCIRKAAQARLCYAESIASAPQVPSLGGLKTEVQRAQTVVFDRQLNYRLQRQPNTLPRPSYLCRRQVSDFLEGGVVQRFKRCQRSVYPILEAPKALAIPLRTPIVVLVKTRDCVTTVLRQAQRRVLKALDRKYILRLVEPYQLAVSFLLTHVGRPHLNNGHISSDDGRQRAEQRLIAVNPFGEGLNLRILHARDSNYRPHADRNGDDGRTYGRDLEFLHGRSTPGKMIRYKLEVHL